MPSIIPIIAYVLFVGGSYVVAIHLAAPKGPRNDPRIIKSRVIRVSLVSILQYHLAQYILVGKLRVVPNNNALLQILGLKSLYSAESSKQIYNTLKLFLILFAGPVLDLVIECDFNFYSHYASISEAIRDLLVAPLTEEFFYTSLTTGSLLAFELSKRNQEDLTSYSPALFYKDPSITRYLELSPLVFGFAHLNHGIEMYRAGHYWGQIIGVCGFQCLYTTLFGYLTNRVFVNTGNFWCCFAAHSFCNFIGFPKLTTEGRLPYKILYWGLLLAGIYGFGSMFDELTYGKAW